MKIFAKLIGLYLNLLVWINPKAAGKKGFWLFCKPTPPPVKPYHRAFFETGEMKAVAFGKEKLETYRWGKGEKTVLFVHGWQSHSFRWKSYIEEFVKQGYTVCAFDAPAHGLSTGKYIHQPMYAAAVEQVVNEIGPVQAIISHSFGSFASLFALHRTPQLPVSRLVIMGTPGEGTDFATYYRGLLGLSDRVWQAMQTYFIEEVDHPIEYFSTVRFASTLTLPGLIVHDKDDLETPYKNAVRIHEVWKNSRLLTTSGLGHNLKSPEVMQKVVEFVAEQDLVNA